MELFRTEETSVGTWLVAPARVQVAACCQPLPLSISLYCWLTQDLRDSILKPIGLVRVVAVQGSALVVEAVA